MSQEELDWLLGEIRELRAQVLDIHTRVVTLENVRALAWKWGAGAAAAIATIITVWHAIWSML